MHRHRTLPFLPLVGAALLLVASASPAAALSVPGAPACPVFPADNVWNKPVNQLPVRGDSHTLVTSIGLTAHVHPDFSDSDGAGYGIPYNVVGHLTPRYHVKFRWPGESDAGPYPIPAHVKIEGGSDRHILAVDRDNCKLYELFAAVKKSDGWHAGSGAIWDLSSNALRPKGWTSADAAGLPILPGLVRYDEVAAGVITHALRFTATTTRTSYIYPARHQAGDSNAIALPPMGLRVRLKANFDVTGFGTQSRVLLTALKTYGMILADNGSPWYISGAPSPGWNDDELHKLNEIPGSAFEAVDTSSLRNGP
jgi:hypothetical protein